MVAYSAVGYEAKGATKPALGSLKIEADTKVAVSDRLVNFKPLQVTESNFPTLKKEETREVVAEIVAAIPDEERVIALDRVLAHVDKSQILPKNAEGVKADPPKIFFSQTPAVVVNLDGEVIWSPIRENDLKFAVNTNWDLFQHEPTKTLYLRYEKSWLQAKDVAGPWTPAGKLPESFSKLPADDNWKEVKAALPGQKLGADKMPKLFVSTTPAELILLTGAPLYKPVAGTKLLVGQQHRERRLPHGRHGAGLLPRGRPLVHARPGSTGPWTFATPSLPADFQKIPLEHPRSRVLAAVPGTQQAAEAVLLAQVPQTARVNRKELKAPEVAYQGEPKFEPIEQTKVEQAVNTDKQIIKVGDLYYMCFQGVWFMSKSATGPWEVTSKVPKEIYEIPASSSAHNVTYVTVVEDDSDDEWVEFATVAAYTGMMVAWGCAVWGSGWYYPPYWGLGGGYPYYYPRYPTYGYGAWYNPWTGGYGRSAVAYGPYGGAGVDLALQPAHRHLLARRGGLGSVWRARLRRSLQPAHRRLRADAPGLERLRQLGHDVRAARRPVGADRAYDEPRDRHHDARDADERGRSRRHAQSARGRQQLGRRADRQRRRVRRPRRQRLPQRGRQLAEVRQRQLGQRRQADAPIQRPRERRTAADDAWRGLLHEGPAQPRLGRAPRRPAAQQRLQQLQEQRQQRQQPQLELVVPLERLPRRRRRARRGRPAAVKRRLVRHDGGPVSLVCAA